MVSGQVNEWTS